MNFSFDFQVGEMDAVETGEWIALSAATRNVMLFLSKVPSASRADTSASKEKAEPAEASPAGFGIREETDGNDAGVSEEKSATLDPARETGCEGSSVAEGADATPVNVSKGHPVTAGYLACKHALPDGAVATMSPPRVIDPGSWMPRPSPELEARRELSFREDRLNNRSLGALRAVPDASEVFAIGAATALGAAVAALSDAVGATIERSEKGAFIQASASGAGQ